MVGGGCYGRADEGGWGAGEKDRVWMGCEGGGGRAEGWEVEVDVDVKGGGWRIETNWDVKKGREGRERRGEKRG